jgi:hypothetical protein
MRTVAIGPLRAILGFAALAVAGCATAREPVQWDFARMEAVARAVENDPEVARREEALFEAGLAHALPHSPVFDPDRARERFDRLLRDHPRTRHRASVTYLVPLLDATDLLRRELAGRAQEVEQLRGEAAEMRERLATLEQANAEEATANTFLRVQIERLEATIRSRDAAIRALEEKLQGLVRIDLRSGG